MGNDYACCSFGGGGRLMGMTEFIFPKTQENKQMFSQKKSERQKVHNFFTYSDARNSSTYYLKSNLREGVIEILDVAD